MEKEKEGKKTNISFLKRQFYSVGIPSIILLDPYYREIWNNMKISRSYPIINNFIHMEKEEEANLLIIGGYINRKEIFAIQNIYQKMKEIKWCLVIGEEALGGGQLENYFVVKNLKDYIKVDCFISGEQVRPKMIEAGLIDFADKIKSGELFLRN